MSLMEKFSDPALIDGLSFGDKMLASTITMIMGMGITFAILILIWIFIAIMGKVLGAADKKPKAEPAAATAQAPSAAAPVEAAASDDSLVAVIAAAVAAYTGANANNLVVKKIQRISGENTPWGVSALEDRLETRKF